MRIQLKILNKEFHKGYYHGDIHSGLLTQESIEDGKMLPAYATPGSAGMDLRCTEDITIYPGETVKIPTGLAIWIGSAAQPQIRATNAKGQVAGGYWESASIAGFILPRSGLGERGLILANTIGLIDEDYQGQLMISAWNRNKSETEISACGTYTYYTGEIIELKAGDRIAQLLFIPIIKASFDVVEEFSNNTSRGQNGFGSTG